jgi:heavy metal sensor kinase
MQLSIRLRLTLWYVAALACTLLVLGGATYLLTRAGLYHWLDETLAERAEALSEELRLVADRPHLDMPDHGHGAFEGISDGFLILDRTHQVVLARGTQGIAFTDAPAVQSGFAGVPGNGTVSSGPDRTWRVATQPVLSGGDVMAVVLVAHDQEELEEVLARLATVMLAVFPLGLAAAGFGGYVLASRALAPVDRITGKAAQITARNLSERLPVEAPDELGRLAATFNALIERLQQAFEQQRRFTADASHELRTPLATIRAVTSQKLMQRREPEEYEQGFRQVDEAAHYMTRLVKRLLALARADAGQIALERERFDLSELLEHVAAQVGEAWGRTIPVEASCPASIVGDTMRLTELFLNLLENACKYTPPAGSVAVQLTCEARMARIAVRDTGIGIPSEHLPHIFERFYRVDQARTREEGGTGLGLAISHWIAEAHGGTLQAVSAPGQGTTMTVVLPLAFSEGGKEPQT